MAVLAAVALLVLPYLYNLDFWGNTDIRDRDALFECASSGNPQSLTY